MGDISYKPLIEDMTWSFSRVQSFDSCPYKWFLRYIKGWKEDDTFYASYGTFIHKIIQMFYEGKLSATQLPVYYLSNFKQEVRGNKPKEETVRKYINSGAEYFRNFKPFPFDYVAVEKKVEFQIDGIPFVGFIDYLGEKDGEYYIVDNKSRDLKPRSMRAKPTKKDLELDEMLMQLYLYSIAIKEEFGKYPKELCFNCFKNGQFIREPFVEKKLEEAKRWAVDAIRRIENEEAFKENEDVFKCSWLCGYADRCEFHQDSIEEYKEEKREERRRGIY